MVYSGTIGCNDMAYVVPPVIALIIDEESCKTESSKHLGELI